ncbi:MAG: metallophosphoesterase family protein [Treponema sp.]|nr:metallophosphoesterase family protein [Treponema sp.]
MNTGNSSILVISDSHGNVPALTAALTWARQVQLAQDMDFSAALFLGDGGDDLVPASAKAGFAVPWYKVRGNGDYNFLIPDTLTVEIPRKLFLAHGNHYGVDGGGQNIAAAARNAGAEAAFFGHTHIPHCSMVNGIFLLNPGSIGRSRSNAGPTFAVIECPVSGPLTARFFCLVNKSRKIEVKELEL